MLTFAGSLMVCLHNISQPPSFYTLRTLWSQQGTFYIIFTEGLKFSRHMETSSSKTQGQLQQSQDEKAGLLISNPHLSPTACFFTKAHKEDNLKKNQ